MDRPSAHASGTLVRYVVPTGEHDAEGKLNNKGQITIPAALRAKYGLREGDEVSVVEDGDGLRIVRLPDAETRGERLARRLRGRGSAKQTEGMSTDELMQLLRGK